MLCHLCGKRTKTHRECDMCYHMRGNMKHNDFIHNCMVIHYYTNYNSVIGKVKKKHQMCRQSRCDVHPDYTNFKETQKRRGGNLTFEEWQDYLEDRCYYCGGKASGIDRITNSRGYHRNNIVSSCALCNYMKGRYTRFKFLLQVDNIYNTYARNTDVD